MLALRCALLQLRARRLAGLVREGSTACACATAKEGLELSQPEPGSVPEYHQHLLIRLPPPAGCSEGDTWWPQFVEKDSAIFEAFKAIAKHKAEISSLVKITAYDDVGCRKPLSPGTCDLLAYPEGVRFRGLPLARLEEAVLQVAADEPVPLAKDLQTLQEEVREVHIFVCCHGARDARCGALGPPLAARLLMLVRQRGLQDRVKVYKTSHVGGHKYAGNVLVYGAMHPSDGDWFGGLNADNAEEFLDALVDIEIGADGGAEDPALRQWWRGRMGLSRPEQLELYEEGGAISDMEEEGDSGDEDFWGESSEGEEEEEEEQGRGRSMGRGGRAGAA